MRNWRLLVAVALLVGLMFTSMGCSLHVAEMPTVKFEVTGPKDVDIHWGKPADIFAAGRARAQKPRLVSQESIDDLKLEDVRP